jgi:hypothetical protein
MLKHLLNYANFVLKNEIIIKHRFFNNIDLHYSIYYFFVDLEIVLMLMGYDFYDYFYDAQDIFCKQNCRLNIQQN